MHGQRDEPGARSQRRLAREPRRPRHARAAADDEHVPVAALVRGARPPRQCACDRLLADESRGGNRPVEGLCGTARSSSRTRPTRSGPSPDVEPELAPDEGHREIRTHRVAQHRAAVGVQARGNVHGHDRLPGRVDRARSRTRPRRSLRARVPCRRSHPRSRRPRGTDGDQGSQRPPPAEKSSNARRASPASDCGSPSATTAMPSPCALARRATHVAVAAVVPGPQSTAIVRAAGQSAQSASSVAPPARVMSS